MSAVGQDTKIITSYCTMGEHGSHIIVELREMTSRSEVDKALSPRIVPETDFTVEGMTITVNYYDLKKTNNKVFNDYICDKLNQALNRLRQRL